MPSHLDQLLCPMLLLSPPHELRITISLPESYRLLCPCEADSKTLFGVSSSGFKLKRTRNLRAADRPYRRKPGNEKRTDRFYREVRRHWMHALRRRSQRPGMTWERLPAIARRYLPYPPTAGSEAPLSCDPIWRHYLRQEPFAVILHVRICAGASGNRCPYRDIASD